MSAEAATSAPTVKGMRMALRDLMPPGQVNKAVLISLRNNFVFTRVPKVANSSIKHLVYSMEQGPGGTQIASFACP